MLSIMYKTYFTNAMAAITATPPPGQKHPNVNSVSSGYSTSQDYGLIADELIKLKDWFIDGLTYIGQFLILIMNWSSRFVILASIIIFFCSGEKKYISTAIKWGIVYVIFCELGGLLM